MLKISKIYVITVKISVKNTKIIVLKIVLQNNSPQNKTNK